MSFPKPFVARVLLYLFAIGLVLCSRLLIETAVQLDGTSFNPFAVVAIMFLWIIAASYILWAGVMCPIEMIEALHKADAGMRIPHLHDGLYPAAMYFGLTGLSVIDIWLVRTSRLGIEWSYMQWLVGFLCACYVVCLGYWLWRTFAHWPRRHVQPKPMPQPSGKQEGAFGQSD